MGRGIFSASGVCKAAPVGRRPAASGILRRRRWPPALAEPKLRKRTMAKYMGFAPWINRLVLAAATIIFMTIGLRYIADPVGASAATGVSLHGKLAITTTRIGFGAFP